MSSICLILVLALAVVPLAVSHPTDVEDVQVQHQDLFHRLFCQSFLHMIVSFADNLQCNIKQT